MVVLAGKCLIDTNVLIYATYEEDARHAIARNVIEQAKEGQFEALVSVQNLAEMYSSLTGPKRKPPDSPALARKKIESIARLRFIRVLAIDDAVLSMALQLCKTYNVKRQNYFDMQLVATMSIHGIGTVVTENASDFEMVHGLRVVNPFNPE